MFVLHPSVTWCKCQIGMLWVVFRSYMEFVLSACSIFFFSGCVFSCSPVGHFGCSCWWGLIWLAHGVIKRHALSFLNCCFWGYPLECKRSLVALRLRGYICSYRSRIGVVADHILFVCWPAPLLLQLCDCVHYVTHHWFLLHFSSRRVVFVVSRSGFLRWRLGHI